MGKVVALTNQKGGVGKTTTSVNLASCLAAAEKKVLMVDLDPQGNGSSSVGLKQGAFAGKNIYQALIGKAPPKECVYRTDLPNFEVIPSNNNLSGAEIELVGAMAREYKLKACLDQIRGDYDYILIDCPPSLGLLTVNALCAADSYLVPMQTEYLAMEGLAQLTKTVELIQQTLNQQLRIEGIVLTMFDSRSGLHKQVAQDVREHFKEAVFDTMIPRNVKLAEGPSFGRPIILYDIESKGSEAYVSLAREFLVRERKQKEWQKKQQEKQKETPWEGAHH